MKRNTLFNRLAVLSLILVSAISVVLLPAVAQGSDLFIDSGQSLGNAFSSRVALGDLDGDGDFDAFVVNYIYGNKANKVWFNDGTGIFSDSGQQLGNAHSTDVALGDVDGDGDLDAFIANIWGHANRVWLNNGTGIFTDSGQSLGNSSSEGVALGDLDNDGDLDAFVTNDNQPNKVWLNDGTGTFTDSGQVLDSALRSFGVDLGDVDGDGDLDAFVVNNDFQPNKVWLNDGTGVFTDSGQNLGALNSYVVLLGDLDGDGDLDAFVVNASNQPNKVWLNDGTGTFSDSGQSLGNSNSARAALGDVDGDSDLDVFVGNSGQLDEVWLNDGTGTFTDSGQRLDGGFGQQTAGVALGDIDSDGDLDAFVTYPGYTSNPGQANKVWLNISAEVSKDISGVDRITETPIFDVFAGDIFTYTIEFENPFAQAVYVMVSDTLDAALDYVSDSLLVNGTSVDAFNNDELMYIDHWLDVGASLSLTFEVEVQNVPVGTLIDNSAWITAYTNPSNIPGTTLAEIEAIAPQAHVVPEPSTLLLFGMGLAGISGLVGRKLRNR